MSLLIPLLSAILAATPIIAPDDGAPGPTTRAFSYKSIPGGALELVVHLPTGWEESDRRPAIVFFFGGGWTNGSIGQFERLADHLARRGMIAVRADYRVKSRQEVAPDDCVEDAKSAVRWIRANAPRLGVDPDRIVAAGGSAGGHIAACTAFTEGLEAEGEDHAVSSRPAALVLFNPVLRFDGSPELMRRIGDDEAIGRQISPTLHLSGDAPPALLLYGTDDRLIEQGHDYIARANEVGAHAELFTAEGQGHGFFNRPPWQDRTLDRADEFLTALGYLGPRESAEPDGDAGWVLLFDGEGLDDWTVRGGRATYSVADGEIVGTTVEGSPNTFLCTGDYRNFELELEVQCDPRLNSGVQVRSHSYERDTPQESNPSRVRPAGTVFGPQCEIAAADRGTSGNFWDEARRTRWLDDFEDKPEARSAFREGEWNHYRIVVRGNRYRSWINGVPCADFADDLDDRGFIGLQVHGIPGGQGPYQVRWRDVRLRKLASGGQP